MGSIFDSSSETETKSKQKNNSTSTTEPFSGAMATNYNNFLDAAKNNYDTSNANWNTLINSNSLAGDTSWLKDAYGKYKNVDNSILNTLNTGSVNPNDNTDWVNAQNTIDSNARKQWGSTINQVNQNIIGKGMANGSGHQSALYNASSTLNSQLASDRANRWASQYNQNVQNALAANGKLQDFYQKMADIGVDYAKLTQEDIATLLNAYNSQANNPALTTYGKAIEMGSNPITKSDSTMEGSSTSTTENSPSLFNDVAGLAMTWAGGKKANIF
jgi:hypothetical protein